MVELWWPLGVLVACVGVVEPPVDGVDEGELLEPLSLDVALELAEVLPSVGLGLEE